jgi:hypothetical protein
VAHVHEERHGLLQIFPERYLAAPAVVALCTIATWGFVAGRFLPSIARNCPPLHHEPLGRLRSKPRTTWGEACGSIEPLQHHLRLRLDAVLQLLPSLKGGEGATVHDVPGELELLNHSGIHGLVLHLVCRELQGDGGVAKRAPAEAAQTHGESKVVSRVVVCTYKQQPRHKRNAGCPRKLRDLLASYGNNPSTCSTSWVYRRGGSCYIDMPRRISCSGAPRSLRVKHTCGAGGADCTVVHCASCIIMVESWCVACALEVAARELARQLAIRSDPAGACEHFQSWHFHSRPCRELTPASSGRGRASLPLLSAAGRVLTSRARRHQQERRGRGLRNRR